MSCSDSEMNPRKDPAVIFNDYLGDDSPVRMVRLNVGGRLFNTSIDTLRKFPNTLLGSLSPQSPYFNRWKREYFFDRNATIFAAILDLYRNNELHLPQNVCGNATLRELEFWRVPVVWVAACCWSNIYNALQDEQLASDLHHKVWHHDPKKKKKNSMWTSKVWKVLTEPRSSTVAMLWNMFVVMATLVLAVMFSLSTFPQFRENLRLSPETMDTLVKYNGTKLFVMLTTKACLGVLVTDVSVLGILVVEFLVKICVCPNLKSFVDCFNTIYGFSLLASGLAHIFENYFFDEEPQRAPGSPLRLRHYGVHLGRLRLLLRTVQHTLRQQLGTEHLLGGHYHDNRGIRGLYGLHDLRTRDRHGEFDDGDGAHGNACCHCDAALPRVPLAAEDQRRETDATVELLRTVQEPHRNLPPQEIKLQPDFIVPLKLITPLTLADPPPPPHTTTTTI